jgi:RNA polymerase subunit RPABC4/transcription elongation factor Spt4
MNCGTILGEHAEFCPVCDSEKLYHDNPGMDNVDKKLSSSPSLMSEYIGEETIDNPIEIERLIKRGEECYRSGKAWQGAKDRTRARKEFQRAFKYYEIVLKIDPENEAAREARAKCLFKMA